jgi:UDP-N-acetylmuramate dehydrogenase
LKLPLFIFGGGSNILFSDKGFEGLVIKIKNEEIEIDGTKIYAGAGVMLGRLVNVAAENGLSGLEWASGIPGTVGGAVRGNAGAYGHDIGESVESVEVLRITNHESRIMSHEKKECEFNYRESLFKKNKDIILKVCLILGEGDKEKIKNEMDSILKMRNEKLPLEFGSAGSVFKNIEVSEEILEKLRNYEIPPKFIELGKIPAAWLIENCSLKGKRVGGAQISEKHANFIVNTGGAETKDILDLINLIKQEIREKIEIKLEEEIEVVEV